MEILLLLNKLMVLMYANIKSNDIKMYDYIEKGNLIGEANGKKLYMVFQKQGVYLDYKEYI